MPAPTSEQLNIYETTSSRIAVAIEGLSEAAMHHKPEEERSLYDIFNLYLEHGDIHLHQIQRPKELLPTLM